MSDKLKNVLFLYLGLFIYLLLIFLGGATIFLPILLGLLVNPYCYYFLILSMFLLPLVYVGIIKGASYLSRLINK